MATRTYMQQVGDASNRSQSFHQGPLLQKARATYQGAMNDAAQGVPAGGLSVGMFGARPAYMPSEVNNRIAPTNPILAQLNEGRAGGFAQHASYGPDNNRGYAQQNNPILANFGTFNPGGPATGAQYSTEVAPSPAVVAPVAPTAPVVGPAGTPSGDAAAEQGRADAAKAEQKRIDDQKAAIAAQQKAEADAAAAAAAKANQGGSTSGGTFTGTTPNPGVGSVPKNTAAPIGSNVVGVRGYVNGGINRGVLTGGNSVWVYKNGAKTTMNISNMTDTQLHQALSDPSLGNGALIAKGYVYNPANRSFSLAPGYVA